MSYGKILFILVLLSAIQFAATCVCGSCGGCTTQLQNVSCDRVNVQNDLIASGGVGANCISILSALNNKIFDCQGFRIVPGTGEDTGILFSSVTNSVITNCKVSDFQTAGIALSFGSNNTINNTLVLRNKYGINLAGSTLNNLYLDNVSNNTNAGISAYSGASSNRFSNIITVNDTLGISFSAGTNNNSVTNSQASNNTNGISIVSSSNTTLTSNVEKNNNIGVYLLNATKTLISQDSYQNNTLDLLFNASTATTNTILNLTDAGFNSPDSSYGVGISLNDSVTPGEIYSIKWSNPPSPLPVYHSNFANHSVNISRMAGSVSIDSIAWEWSVFDVFPYFSYNESRFELWKYNGTWSNTSATLNTIPLVTHYLNLSNMNPASTYSVLQNDQLSIANCPLINTSGTYVMTGNFIGAPNSGAPFAGATACVKIAASNVIFDCNGFNMTNNLAGTTIGIMTNVSASGVTIKNCPGISNYTYGVYTYSTSNGLITNSTTYNFSQNGFYINGGSNINVTNNIAKNSPGAGGFSAANGQYINFVNNSAFNLSVGIRSQTDHVQMINNTVRNATSYGIIVISTYNNVTGNMVNLSAYGYDLSSSSLLNVSNNLAYDCPYGYGIYATNNCMFANNTAKNSSSRGFDLANSNANNLTGNTAYNDSNGFYLYSSNNNALTNNTAHSNKQVGFVMLSTSNNNTLARNIAYNNSISGFYLDSSSDNTLMNDISYNNTISGYYLTSSSNSNTLANNTGYNNTHSGFDMISCSNNLITNSTAYNNSQYGFHLDFNSNGNTLSNDTAFNNTYHGFYLSSASNLNTIARSNSFNNSDGFNIQSCAGNNLTSNLAHDNRNNGVSMFPSVTGSNLINNTAYGNPIMGFYLYSGSNDNLIANNTGYNNVQGSFWLKDTSGNVLSNNTALGTGIEGFVLENSNLSRLTNNRASGNSQYGYLLMSNSNNDNLSGDIADTNSQTGFYLQSVFGNNLSGNFAYNNPSSGFFMSGGGSNYLAGNIANLSGACFHTLQSNGNTFLNNTAYNSNFRGFMLDQSNGTICAGNTVHDCVHSAFETSLSNNGVFSNNTGYNDQYGFVLWIGSNNNNLTGNEFYSNMGVPVSAGIYVYQSAGVRMANNSLHGNAPQSLLISQSNGTAVDGGGIYNNSQYGVNLQATNATLAGSHLFNNGADALVNGSSIINLSDVVFDRPAGDFQNFTNLSIIDIVNASTAYTLNWSAAPSSPPGKSFLGKFVNISNMTPDVSIDNITWRWTDAELAGFSESSFQLYKYSGAWSAVSGAALNTGADSLSKANLIPAGVYGILQVDSSSSHNSNPSTPALSVALGSNCSGNIVTITSGSTDVEGASVYIDNADTLMDVASGTSDSSGQFSFSACDLHVRIRASKSGYQSQEMITQLAACGACAGCVKDADCPLDKACSAGSCVAVPCVCGNVSNHQCTKYACCSDTDCGSNKRCTDHTCVAVEQPKPECTTDSNCGSGKACASGKCVVKPECMKDSDCQGGYGCKESKCVKIEVAPTPPAQNKTTAANGTPSGQPSGQPAKPAASSGPEPVALLGLLILLVAAVLGAIYFLKPKKK